MIAVFDSGIGGLGILSMMLPLFDGESVVYAADRANAPYGTKSLDEVRQLTHDNARRLIDLGASTVVLACNTASAAALDSLREQFNGTRFVGMEPALKPASAATRSGVVGVVATSATFQGRLFESLMDRFAEGLRVITRAAPEWVEIVEKGDLTSVAATNTVRMHTDPLIEEGADTLVLGCTHFGFLAPTIVRAAGDELLVIDPAPAVARQARAVHVNDENGGSLSARVSGDAAQFANLSKTVAGISFPDGVLPL